MSERITQIQDVINEQAEHFCNAIGILQEIAAPSKFAHFTRIYSPAPEESEADDYPLHFAQLISRCGIDINFLIDSLPDDINPEPQLQILETLESENKEATQDLIEIVNEGLFMLELIRTCIQATTEALLRVNFKENKNKQNSKLPWEL